MNVTKGNVEFRIRHNHIAYDVVRIDKSLGHDDSRHINILFQSSSLSGCKEFLHQITRSFS